MEELGFTREPNRLNVAITRARDGLIIVGDIKAIETNSRRSTKYLSPIISDFKQKRQVRTIDDPAHLTNQFVSARGSRPTPPSMVSTESFQDVVPEDIVPTDRMDGVESTENQGSTGWDTVITPEESTNEEGTEQEGQSGWEQPTTTSTSAGWW